MFSLRTHALICGGIFALTILIAILGNILEAAGIVLPERAQAPAQIVFFLLFLGIGFSAIPLMVKLVLAAQVRLGNADKPIIRTLIAHQNRIIWAMWIVCLAGLALAVPAAIEDGMFGDSAARELRALMLGRSQGTLVANVGMTPEDVAQHSSLKIGEGSKPNLLDQTQFGGGGVFDFEVAGTGMKFERCRYFFIVTRSREDRHIQSMSIGTSPDKVTRAELDAANAGLRKRLGADGWLTAHRDYVTEEQQQLHGGETRSEEGWIWQKDDTILHIMNRRMDDEAPGEDKATAGEWIQYVDLWERKSYPGYETYVFTPPQ